MCLRDLSECPEEGLYEMNNEEQVGDSRHRSREREHARQKNRYKSTEVVTKDGISRSCQLSMADCSMVKDGRKLG